MIIYKKASRNDLDGIYDFCQKLIVEAVQMSFVDVTSPEVLESWFEKSEYDMYIGVLEESPHNVVGMLRTKVGSGDQSHSIYYPVRWALNTETIRLPLQSLILA